MDQLPSRPLRSRAPPRVSSWGLLPTSRRPEWSVWPEWIQQLRDWIWVELLEWFFQSLQTNLNFNHRLNAVIGEIEEMRSSRVALEHRVEELESQVRRWREAGW